VDPVPAIDMRLAPAAHMAIRMNPYANTETLARKNVGDILKAMASVGVAWPAARVAWDRYRPRPETAQFPPEVVFVSAGSGNASAFNRKHPVTAGLQNMTLPYPGYLSAAAGAEGITFEPLLQTGPQSGNASYFQVVQPGPAGPVLNVNLPHVPEGKPLTLAAHVRSPSTNAIVIADLDFISDQVFAARAGDASADVSDNVAFLVNAIDVLAGDDSFVPLRSHRVAHPTLERVETQMRTFVERRQQEESQAAAEAQAALDAAQRALEQRLGEIDARPDLDAQARQILARNVEETEKRKLGMQRTNIDLAKNAKIQASREKMEASILTIQRNIRVSAVLVPPALMLTIGVVVWLVRRRREWALREPRP
jgi:ABC-2 type transport system permease protein